MLWVKYQILKLIYKFLNAVEKVPGMSRLLNGRLAKAPRDALFIRYVRTMPDRRYLDRVIIPELPKAGVKRILCVGCAPYTRHNPALLEALGIECWTADILPENAEWGSPQHHLTCDIADIEKHVPAPHFDAVLFNGVMGYGVTGEMMKKVAPALHAVLKPAGILIVGWNKGRVESPCSLDAVNQCFEHKSILSLPFHKEIPSTTHVFDWFVKKDADGRVLPEGISHAA